ncbi:MAG TPA: ABC transporter ATP-binding protein [Candidatus Acetatifactor stercoripullorum]|uniref:ABC transporter ATP-binding protein n=1 Tax=Candidatus Acetatifactor stercoripullorum TaxID=2838414 RepID=A0A9D1R660_9FIRM|nr:ABC transporter ATP-binding protein [Candidatus Acetatifactor stercoripullorum]HIW81624.1 ABC transporter ATP-binding protein [Candidatus Acetatifactor stercoripullorum]
MISFENVKKTYGNFTMHCTMEVKPGRITGLIGPNGAGKTTAFKAVLNLISIDSGTLTVLGKPSGQLTARDMEKIGAVLSDSGFCGYLTVRDLVPVLKNFYEEFSVQDFQENCQKLSLPLDKKIKEFSSGMKAKLKVLAAISHNPQLLVLDEPTAGLDVLARDSLLQMLREYMEQEDRSILISSHISSDLEGLCDDVYLIDQGKILLHEETDVLLSDYAILKVTPEQYASLDQSHLLRRSREAYGFCLLTDQKQFYLKKYPSLVIERGGIDEVITMMIRGEKL